MIRKIARPMLASVFVYDGVDTLRNTSDHVEETESFLQTLRKALPGSYAGYVPNDPELVARGLGGAKVGAGSLLALGKAPRTSAAVLAAATLPTMLTRNNFWEADSAEEKTSKRNGLLTNTALLGALFITTQDTAGKPSLRWRAQKAGERTNKKIQQALPTKSESQKFADDLSERASDFSDRASDWFNETSDKVQAYVDDNKDDWQESGKDLLETAKGYVNDAKDFVTDNKDDWLKAAQDNAETARKGAVKAASRAQEKAEKARSAADKKNGKRAAKKASKNADKLQKRADKAIAKAMQKLEGKL
ncbi:DoxX family protein [Corynebacterium confusum]|uniref:DoxX family protein n=1 Tax=Corynebacterium confusum TaxID=71254 RepID=UPI0025B3A978|nr:DoxX family membrane protein [Corynebacterium confusum]WJY89651.1 DoxX [Corynebacterium confusum]